MNGAANCILEICCPPNADGTASINAKRELSSEIGRSTGLSLTYSDRLAEWIYTNFDLAERGSLVGLKASIAKHARQGS